MHTHKADPLERKLTVPSLRTESLTVSAQLVFSIAEK